MIFSTTLYYVLINLSFITMGVSEPCPIFQWLMMELSVLSLIPILLKSGVLSSVTSGLKYFLSQSPASLLILFSFCMLNTGVVFLVLPLALVFKLGLPPFHGWVFSLSSEINVGELGLVLTIQKFLPLTMLTSYYNLSLFAFSLIISIIMISFSCNSNIQLKQLLILSSIGGSFWPLLTQSGSGFWLDFMLVYSCLLLFLTHLFYSKNVMLLKDLINLSFTMKTVLLITLFSVGGVPPFSGFFIKLMLLKQMISISLFLSSLLLILSFIVLYLFMLLISVSGVNALNINFDKCEMIGSGLLCLMINSPLILIYFTI